MKSLRAFMTSWLQGPAAVRRTSTAFGLVVALALGLTGICFAHGTKTPHTLVLTQVEVNDESLHVSVWVERPVARVVEEFKKTFAPDRQRASEQEESFREAQWARLARELALTANGVSLDAEWKPVDLANNGRGDAQKFVYAIESTLPLVGVLTQEFPDRLVVEVDNQVLLDEPHVFLSSYAEVDSPWSVRSDSHDDLRASDRKTIGSSGGETTWTHDARARTWRLVFTRAR